MNAKNKGNAVRRDGKGGSNQRPHKEEHQKPPLGDSKKASVGRKTADGRPKRPPATSNAPSVQLKTQMAAASWVKGGSSLSFADVVRKRSENSAVHVNFVSPEETDVVYAEQNIDVVEDINEEENIDIQPLSDPIEDMSYVAMQQDGAIIQAVIPPPPEEELEEATTIKYYMLEIDRIAEEPILLPPQFTTIAAEHIGAYTFSGQAGKPPTPPTAPIQTQFYRPETTAARSFGTISGAPEINRNAHWNTQPGHSVDYSSVNWRLQEGNTRSFQPGIQYNSYAPPMQQQQQQQQARNFNIPTLNRMRQTDIQDASLRTFRDAGTFSRHPGNGGGVW